jgi:hypothetical protein
MDIYQRYRYSELHTMVCSWPYTTLTEQEKLMSALAGYSNIRHRHALWRQIAQRMSEHPRTDWYYWKHKRANRFRSQPPPPWLAFIIHARCHLNCEHGRKATHVDGLMLDLVERLVVDEWLFALVVFYTDGYLQPATHLQPVPVWREKLRFFRIMAKLPLKLQMVVCSRSLNSPKDVITTQMSEPAFKAVAAMRDN